MIYKYPGGGGVGSLKKLINRDGDAEEVCSFAHIEIIYIRLHGKKIKTLSICPHYHPTARKRAKYNT